jgi:hypothetical protein
MKIIRRILRPAGFLGRAAAIVLGGLLALTAASPAAFAMREPPPGGGGTTVENTPPVVHTVTVGGTPGWQIALLAIGAALVTAFIAVLLDRARGGRGQQLSADTR